MKVLIDISDEDYVALEKMQAAGETGHYHELILKGAKLRNHPNNMEMLNAVFPDANICICESLYRIEHKIDVEATADWVYAPYGRVVVK